MPTSPGMSVLVAPSTIVAPAGGMTLAALPTAAILP